MTEQNAQRRRARIVSVALALALAALGVWTFFGLEVHHEITGFLPSADDRALARIAREVVDSELGRTIAIAVGADEPRAAMRGAQQLAARLRAIEGLAWVRTGPAPDLEATLYELYFPRRYAFFAEDEAEARARLTDEALSRAAQRLRRELASPTAMLVRRIAPEDPLLAFADYLRRLRNETDGGPRVVDGQFLSTDGWALVVLATRAPTFDTARTGPLLAAIEAACAQVRRAHGGRLRFEQASVHRFAVRAERAIRADVQRISTLSTIGVVVLFLLLYGGPRFLVLGALPLAAGTIVATAACRLLFGGVHGITLAFGSSLLGVGIDYVAHYASHCVLEPDEAGPGATMRRLWPGLALGAATTVAGLAGLAWTPFPAMREMALFGAVGVTVALLATRALVPPWMPASRAAPLLARLAAIACDRLWRALQTRRAPPLVLGLGAAVVVALGLPRLAWNDDIRALGQTDPALRAEDARVRARIAQGEPGRFVIATGADDEEALARNDAVYAALTRARSQGTIGAFRSIHPLLRAAALQDRVQSAVLDAPRLAERTLHALAAAGFVPELFEPFRASLVRRDPLTWRALARSAALDLVRPFRVEIGDRVGYLSFVEGVRDPRALRAALAGLEGVEYFDQAAFLVDAYRTFRARTVELLIAGLVVVLALCLVRYRSVVLGLASVLPAVLAAATTLGWFGLFGETANLMHLVGALLVVSMGEDYAVFLIESRHDPRRIAPTMVGIAVACATTVLSFGLLATSSHPAMRALGLMTSVGVATSFVLAPLALVLVGGRTPTKGSS